MVDYRARVLYSKIINVAKFHIMMVKPPGSPISKGLLSPFSTTVWLFTLLAFILVGPVIYVSIILLRYFGGHEKITTLSEIVWFIYGALVRQGHSCKISPINGKLN